MRTNVGELTTSWTPSPAANPFANCVLPAPRSPRRHRRSPGSAAAARRDARSRVSAASLVTTTRSRDVGADIQPRVAQAVPPRVLAARVGRSQHGSEEALEVAEGQVDDALAVDRHTRR